MNNNIVVLLWQHHFLRINMLIVSCIKVLFLVNNREKITSHDCYKHRNDCLHIISVMTTMRKLMPIKRRKEVRRVKHFDYIRPIFYLCFFVKIKKNVKLICDKALNNTYLPSSAVLLKSLPPSSISPSSRRLLFLALLPCDSSSILLS